MTATVTIINRTTINRTKMKESSIRTSIFPVSHFCIDSDNIPCANKLHFMVALNPQAAKTQLSVTEENYKELLLRLC